MIKDLFTKNQNFKMGNKQQLTTSKNTLTKTNSSSQKIQKHQLNTKDIWPLYKSIPIIQDNQGYAKSFDVQNYDPQQLLSFYNNYGVVIFHNILTQQEIQKTIDDLWVATKQSFPKADKNIKQTWNFKGMQRSFGFVDNQPLNQLQFWKNRINPRVYKGFRDLYELSSGRQLKQPLIACLDRGSLMRPSKLNQSWKTQDIYHFDIDPWNWTGQTSFSHSDFEKGYQMFEFYQYMLGEGNYKPNIGFTKLAAVLALSDTNENSGGFQAALGFQNYIDKWCQVQPVNTYIDQDEQLLKTFQKVKMRKGSLMIFSRQLPHNIYPNLSQNFRYAQYLRMTPLSTLMLSQQLKQKRKGLIHPMIPQQLQRTDICKEVLMLD